jgi:hypothetical protein
MQNVFPKWELLEKAKRRGKEEVMKKRVNNIENHHNSKRTRFNETH